MIQELTLVLILNIVNIYVKIKIKTRFNWLGKQMCYYNLN